MIATCRPFWTIPGAKSFWNDIIAMNWMIHPCLYLVPPSCLSLTPRNHQRHPSDCSACPFCSSSTGRSSQIITKIPSEKLYGSPIAFRTLQKVMPYTPKVTGSVITRLARFQMLMTSFDQDLAFVAYYIVVFSFIRQSLFLYVLRPLARSYGIRQEGKIERFAEQGYAVIYFTCSGSLGLVRSTCQGLLAHY
jgi:hypothetical protein